MYEEIKRLRGTYDDQKVCIFQGTGDIITQVAGDGQLLFVPEDPADLVLAGFLPDRSGDMVAFQTFLDLSCNSDIRRCMFIGDKCTVMDALIHV